MKAVVISSGHPFSGYERAHATLVGAGLAEERQALARDGSLRELHDRIYEEHGRGPSDWPTGVRLSPSDRWKVLGRELLPPDPKVPNWGWAESRALDLLDFWSATDPRVGFVLVYGAPEVCVAQMLADNEATPAAVGTAVSSWIACNDSMLRFYHRNSGRCQLVHESVIAHDPSRFSQKIDDAFQLGLRTMSIAVPTSSPPSSIAAILARGLIESDRRISSLYREMENSADLPSSGAETTERDAAQIWKQYHALQLRIHQLSRTKEDQKGALDLLGRELQSARAAIAQGVAELAKSESRGSDLNRRLELALAALESVKSETASHFSEASIDMRAQIDGSNWYYAEKDGRWAGPKQFSTIRMPALGRARYEIRLDVVDAMERDILREMKLSINGKELAASGDWKRYPALIQAGFSGEELDRDRRIWEVGFRFPKLVSPAQRGSDDRRELAIRLRKITICSLS